ncbi:MAG: hypothetical protein JWO86_376 [Myxococcaceae bacterium]|nr:hypothetical protein [Myxococcaceae bacterium]MEA2750170.1 hypothetical protein [Myxococcales bacterium]
MTTAPTQHLAPAPGAREDDAIDPELLDLPDPPKRERSVTVGMLLFTAFASLAMVVSLRGDATYAFAEDRPADLGDLGSAPAAAFVENAFVTGTGMLGAAKAIRYERPLVSDSFRLMPVAGRPNVWVEVRVPAGSENIRYVPPSQFTGRLVKFDSAGPKHRGLASAVSDATGQKVPEASWLLVEGDAPTGARGAILLVLMFLGFALWNITAAAKLVRKVRS